MSSFAFNLISKEVGLVDTPNRSIQSYIPAPGTAELLENLAAVESRSMHGQLPVIWDKAEDFSVFDISGNKYIDFTSTIFVANVGHGNKAVANAVSKSIAKPLVSSYSYAHEIRLEYLERLLCFAGGDFEKAFLLSAGTEATEAAFKLMRMNGQKIKKRRQIIITIDGNWHGRTLGAQSLSSNRSQRAWFDDLEFDVCHIPFPYPDVTIDPIGFFKNSIEGLAARGIDPSRDIAGIMLETFQGWGAYFYPTEYVHELKRFCESHHILLTFDEMQSGFGRTGVNFGYEHYGVSSDLICVGKGMGGGFPVSGVIGRSEIMDLPSIGNMSSTHSANPIVCSAGIAVIDEIESRHLCDRTVQLGEVLETKLLQIKSKYPDHIIRINARGLIAAIIFKSDSETLNEVSVMASKIVERSMEKGLLLVHTGRESIKIGPPLTISEDALKEGLDCLEQAIAEIVTEHLGE